MNSKLIIILCLTILIVGPLYSQDFAPVGTAVAQFLEIGVGARGTAMGTAYTALTQDAGSAFWNPAGLADVKKRNFYSAYTQWPADISIGGFAFAMDLGVIGTVAISNIYLMTDDMEITTITQPEGTGDKFGINNYCLGLSYARYLTDRLSIGLTTKLIHEKYLNHGYSSWALDMGTIYRTGFHGLNLGMSILHFGPEVRFDGSFIDYSDPKSVDVNKPKKFETYSLPMNFRFGLSFDLWDGSQNKVTTATDMVHSNNNLEQYNWGIEYSFNRMFFVRGGYMFNSDESGLTLGAGLNLNRAGLPFAALDYSFSDLGVLNSINRLSLALSF